MTTKPKPTDPDGGGETEEELLTLEGPPVSTERPTVKAQVIYLGANPARSLSLRGQVSVERTELAPGETVETKTAGTSGRHKYDFALRDTHGRLNRTRLMPESASVRLRGRPFVWCEHPDHLLAFAERRVGGQPEFFVKFERAEDKRVMDEWAAQARRYRTRAQTQLLENLA